MLGLKQARWRGFTAASFPREIPRQQERKGQQRWLQKKATCKCRKTDSGLILEIDVFVVVLIIFVIVVLQKIFAKFFFYKKRLSIIIP